MDKYELTENLIYDIVLSHGGCIKHLRLIEELVRFMNDTKARNKYITDAKEWYNIINNSLRLDIIEDCVKDPIYSNILIYYIYIKHHRNGINKKYVKSLK